VVGTRRHGALSGLMLGSVGAAVVQVTRTPVIVARGGNVLQ
jgi:nucleotide-binding universal stress UspA family protein